MLIRCCWRRQPGTRLDRYLYIILSNAVALFHLLNGDLILTTPVMELCWWILTLVTLCCMYIGRCYVYCMMMSIFNTVFYVGIIKACELRMRNAHDRRRPFQSCRLLSLILNFITCLFLFYSMLLVETLFCSSQFLSHFQPQVTRSNSKFESRTQEHWRILSFSKALQEYKCSCFLFSLFLLNLFYQLKIENIDPTKN